MSPLSAGTLSIRNVIGGGFLSTGVLAGGEAGSPGGFSVSEPLVLLGDS